MSDAQAFLDRLNAGIAAHEIDNPSMAALAQEHNLTVDHTGGGCLTYAQHQDDGWYFWLTSRDGGSLPDSPAEEGCYGGWYAPEGEFWTCVVGTPADLLSVMWTLGRVARAIHDEGTVDYLNDMPLGEAIRIAFDRGLVHDDECAEALAIRDRPAPVAVPEAPVVGEGLHDALDCAEALKLAQEALQQAMSLTGCKAHLYRKALATVDAILAQQGCEHMSACDGLLTTAMDVAIFG